MAAELSWHVQKILVIYQQSTELQQKIFLLDLDFEWEIVGVMVSWSVFVSIYNGCGSWMWMWEECVHYIYTYIYMLCGSHQSDSGDVLLWWVGMYIYMMWDDIHRYVALDSGDVYTYTHIDQQNECKNLILDRLWCICSMIPIPNKNMDIGLWHISYHAQEQ